jgi:hypothetical protein
VISYLANSKPDCRQFASTPDNRDFCVTDGAKIPWRGSARATGCRTPQPKTIGKRCGENGIYSAAAGIVLFLETKEGIHVTSDKESDMEKRIEQFEYGGKRFFYCDMSHFRDNTQFSAFIGCAKKVIERYPKDKSLFSITNGEGVMFDSETKVLVAEWMEFNRPYIRYGAVIGLDTIKWIMLKSILKLCGRNNIKSFRSKDEAVKWLAAL